MPQPEDRNWLNRYKRRPQICCLQETRLKTRDTSKLKVRAWKKIFPETRDQKKAGVAIFISDKIDFKGCEKRQRRTLHNDQRINPRRYNNYKYI